MVRLRVELGKGANFSWRTNNLVEKAVWWKPFVNLVYTLTSPIHRSTWLGDLWFKVVLPYVGWHRHTIDIKQNLHHIADEVLGLLQLHETISSRWNYNDQKQLQERCTLLTQVCPRIMKQLTSHNQILFIVYLSFQLWTVALCLTQPMAKLVTLLEQHWGWQPPTVVTQATTWWETLLAHVKLMECGLEKHLSVKVCFI